MKATLAWLGVVATVVLALTAAIMAAAPYLAMGIVVAGLFAWFCNDDPDDKEKPQ